MLLLFLKVMSLLLFLIAMFFILNYSVKSKKLRGIFIFLCLLAIGIFIAVYVRKIVYSNLIFASPDESNYIDLAYRVLNNQFAVVSGPGYIFLMTILRALFKIDFLELIPSVSILITCISLLIFYFSYKLELKDSKLSLLSCLVLISTTYFLWPIIEGRPQQIGMLLILPCALFFYKFQNEGKSFFPFLISYLLIFIIHILSFFIISAMILLLSYHGLLKYGKIKKFLFSLSIFLLLVYLFTRNWFIYSNMAGGMLVLLKNYPLCWLNLKQVVFLIIILGLFAFALMTILFIKIDVISKIEHLIKNRYVIILIIIAVVFSLIIQFRMEGNTHMSLYKNSYLYITLFESGNILFGALFLIGLRKQILKDTTNTPFYEYSIILMTIGALMIFASFFFPGGFNNGLIRIINCWTIFAAPIIVPLLLDKKYQRILIILLCLTAVTSLVAASKDPKIFNFELFWSKSDIDAMRWVCNQNGSYILNNTQNSYAALSKEQTYYKLRDIIALKENISCTGQIYFNLENIGESCSYSKDGINIYPIKNLSIINTSDIINTTETGDVKGIIDNTQNKIIKLNSKGHKCPVIKK